MRGDCFTLGWAASTVVAGAVDRPRPWQFDAHALLEMVRDGLNSLAQIVWPPWVANPIQHQPATASNFQFMRVVLARGT